MRAVLAVFALGVLACTPAPISPRTVPRSWFMPVEVRVEAAFEAAVLPVEGPLSQREDAALRLYEEMNRSGMTPFGPTFCLYRSPPGEVSDHDLRWELARPILPGTKVSPPLELRTFPARLVVSTKVRDAAEETPRLWQSLAEWISANGYEPAGQRRVFWTLGRSATGGRTVAAELVVPVERVVIVPLLLRSLVCIAGLSLFAVFLLSRLRTSAATAPLRGGVLWALLGASCALTYLEPLLADLGYAYGNLLPALAGRGFVSARELARAAGGLVWAVMAHLLFRLVRDRLRTRWAFRAAIALLYPLSAIPPFAVALGVAPAALVRLEQGGTGALLRTVATALLVVAALWVARARSSGGDELESWQPGRTERRAYVALATVTLLAALAGALAPASSLRQLGAIVLLAIPIPFLLVTTYFQERSELFDVLAKRGAFLLVAVVALTVYFGLIPSRLWSARLGWVGSWVFPVSALPFMVLAPWLSGWLSGRLDRLWLGRALSSAQAQRYFLAGVGSAASEGELLRKAEERISAIFPAGRLPTPHRRAVTITLGPETPGVPAAETFEAPVVSNGERVGTMRIATPQDARPFLSEDQALFGSLGEALGLALEAHRLREKKLAQERAEQELRVLTTRAELRALRAQINPHFVFNALNAIAELIASDPVRAETTVERLAEVLRRTLRRSDTEWVRVDEELALVRSYLEVEQTRFGQRLGLEVEVGEGTAGALVPAMMVQTLVENAVKHGISKRSGPGRIEVRAAREGGLLRIEVRDTGPGFPDGAGEAGQELPAGGLGLRNVRGRLAGHFGKDGSLSIGRDEEAGMTVVAITLPALSESAKEAR